MNGHVYTCSLPVWFSCELALSVPSYTVSCLLQPMQTQ